MPFVRIFTNLSRNQLPKNFMPKFNAHLAAVLDKDPKVFKWTLETDRMAAQGCEEDGHRNPFMQVEIESLFIFKEPDNCAKYIPQIFDYLIKETNLKEGEIAAKLRDLEPHHVGLNSKSMAS